MRLGSIKATAGKQGGGSLPRADAAPAPPAETSSRALVVPMTPAAARQAPTRYLQAPFLAQLLAVKGDHPQTRERRRAEPSEALSAYRTTAALAR